MSPCGSEVSTPRTSFLSPKPNFNSGNQRRTTATSHWRRSSRPTAVLQALFAGNRIPHFGEGGNGELRGQSSCNYLHISNTIMVVSVLPEGEWSRMRAEVWEEAERGTRRAVLSECRNNQEEHSIEKSYSVEMCHPWNLVSCSIASQACGFPMSLKLSCSRQMFYCVLPCESVLLTLLIKID